MLYRTDRESPSSALRLCMACLASLLLPVMAQANELLALDKGCVSCHGNAKNTGLPTFEQLAAKYAKYQGQTGSAAKLATELRQGRLLVGITAHQQLTQENATVLIRWIIDGAK